ncbi:nitrate ABC transporter substrate-binding protein [Sphingomonas oleivorans]|uniref:Nitrate ABC transporter substrate-binding protein n=1 Tax=Sphingomonas oleivorans TaxID=1735121 RepID=A0A2T5FWL4_9SPHN|nr:ABC transporter substrate-binding protein [Sphingomonas oleivorans]PTQ10174.1 nitrate ABC transporter substrate-binding protein [Sphingomonas oleivorans]
MDVSPLPFDRRAFLAGCAAFGLNACGPRRIGGPTELVLGDQASLSRAKAEAAGVLERVPYRYEWANFVGAAPLFEALAAGAVDTAPAGDVPVIQAIAGKAPLKIIAATRSDADDIAILLPPGSAIRKVADLVGREVIISSARGSISHYLLLGALREAGVAPSRVRIGFMLPNDAAAAFASGRIEAWATFGIYQATAESRGARILRDGRGINSGIGVLAAGDAALADRDKRRALADYLVRQKAANDWARANPEAYARIYAERTGVPIEIIRLVVRRQNPPLIAPDAAISAALQKVADNFYADGVLPERVEIAAYIDASLLPSG